MRQFQAPFMVISENDIEVCVDDVVLTPDKYNIHGIGNADGVTVELVEAPQRRSVVTLRRKVPAGVNLEAAPRAYFLGHGT